MQPANSASLQTFLTLRRCLMYQQRKSCQASRRLRTGRGLKGQREGSSDGSGQACQQFTRNATCGIYPMSVLACERKGPPITKKKKRGKRPSYSGQEKKVGEHQAKPWAAPVQRDKPDSRLGVVTKCHDISQVDRSSHSGHCCANKDERWRNKGGAHHGHGDTNNQCRLAGGLDPVAVPLVPAAELLKDARAAVLDYLEEAHTCLHPCRGQG